MVDPEEESYGIYTETDLDQLTDYSLRYAEQDSDSDDECDKTKAGTTDFVQDTIKTYCTEGTPYETPFNFSTATSMSDLRDVPLETEKQEEKPEVAAAAEAEETPLMFSRSSSLSSIESVDQSIHEDQESIVSDFSLLSSGIISPSDLPDSPTQTIPQSPRQRKSFASKVKVPQVLEEIVESNTVVSNETNAFIQISSTSSMIDLPLGPKTDEIDSKVFSSCENNNEYPQNTEVYSDYIKNYCTEDTPAMLSRIGSNSNLSEISNMTDPKTKTYVSDEGGNLSNSTLTLCMGGGKYGKYLSDIGNRTQSNNSLQSRMFDNDVIEKKDNDLSPLSSESEDDKDILAACISDGIKNNRYRQNMENLVSEYEKIELNEPENVEKEKTDDSPLNSENDEDILAACIKDGIANNRYRRNSKPNQIPIKNKSESYIDEKKKSESENDDENIVAACIKDGIKNNRYRKESKGIEDAENKNLIENKSKNKQKKKIKRDERDKKIIAACISDGIKNNRYRKSDISPVPVAKIERFLNVISTNKKTATATIVCPGTPLKTSSHYNTSNNETIKNTCDQKPRSKRSKIVRVKKNANASNLLGNTRKATRTNEMTFNCVLAEFGPPKHRTANAIQRNLKTHNEQMNNDYTHNYYTEDTPSFLSPAESNLHLNILAKADKKVKEEINMLRKREQNCLNREEIAVYDVENSPCPFSLRSSLSDLTVDSTRIEGSILGPSFENRNKMVNPQTSSRALSPLSITSVSSEEDRLILQQCIADGIKHRRRLTTKSYRETERDGDAKSNDKHVSYTTPRDSFASDYIAESRIPSPIKERDKYSAHSSHSSLSEGSITEQEKALVQQCISDGIQWRRNKKIAENIATHKSSSESLTSERERALVEECIMIGRMSIKNKAQNGIKFDQPLQIQPSTSRIEPQAADYLEKTKDVEKLMTNKKELRRFRIKNWLQKLLPGRKKS